MRNKLAVALPLLALAAACEHIALGVDGLLAGAVPYSRAA